MINKRTTKFYRKNEAEVMEQLGFRPTKNSGAGWIEKEDGQNEQCICQLKSTDKQSISVKQNDLHILEQNAAISHKLPVFAIQFLNTNEVWVMIKPEDLKLIQSLVKGEDITEKLSKGFDFDLDKTEETLYNNYNVPDDVKKSFLARKVYMKQREEEADRNSREYKQKLKRAREKQRERRKQIGKEV